jgi:hypothetical protein
MKMKKIILLCCVLIPWAVNAQTIIFSENFETVSLPDSVTSSGTPNPWTISTHLFNHGAQSDSNKVTATDTSYLTTSAFNTTGNSFVILQFSHICKIELLDAGEIEVSANGGPWIKLTSTEYIDPGNSQFVNMGNKFNSNTYPLLWAPTLPGTVPTNAWWKTEQFNISALVGNSTNVKIRFALRDGNANGAGGCYGWFIDDIRVIMSFSELNPPTINYIQPQYLGTIYNLGPFNVRATVDDVSGIQEADLFYKVNSGTIDSVIMTFLGGDTVQGAIPAVNDLDTVKYFIRAYDASPAYNSARNPTTGFRSFVARTGITFPFTDDFDGASVLFYDSTLTPGTQWELGTPSYGTTNSAHSAPNAWDVNLTSTYGNNVICYLYTPIFDFSTTANAKLSFWINYNVESNWDGTRVEYTTDGTTWTTLGTVGDLNAVNWYNYPSVNSSNGNPVWSGASGGWMKCEYLLTQLNYVAGPTQFRYTFTTDGSGQYDGVSIDDFAIIPPFDDDASAISVLLPDMSSCVAAGNNTFKAVFKNVGANNIVPPFSMSFQVDALTPVSDTWNDTVHPGEQDTITFTTLLNVSQGNHTLHFYTSLTGDQFFPNDTVAYSFSAFAPLSLPYFNFLDSAGALNDFCIQNGTYGRAFFDTQAANTGAGGVILDASSSTGWTTYPDTTIGSIYYVWDPTVDPQQQSILRLNVNSFGYNVLTMKFDAKLIYLWGDEYTNFRVTVNGTMITPHMRPSGSTTAYNTFEYDLSSFLPTPVLTIEFQAKNYASYNYSNPNGSATFLDNIKVYEPPAQEAYMLSMTSPVDGCGLGIEPVTVMFKNTGSDTISGNLDVAYKVNNASPITPEAISTTILPGDTLIHTFSVNLDMSVISADSTFNIKAWVELTGDPFQFNDTVYRTVESLFTPSDPVIASVFTIPYATDTLLHASSTGNVYWYDSPTSTNYIQMGPDYQTPVLYDTAFYYVEARNGSSGTYFYIGTGNIQNGTTSYPSPYGQYYNGAREQFLIPASELTAAGIGPGPINALAFDVVSPAGAPLPDMTVKIGTTSLNSLNSWTPSTSLTQVYYNASYSTITGWNEHLFTTPFVWDGVSNLIVETCFDNYPNGYTTNASLNQTTTTYTSTIDYHTDGGGVCPPLTQTFSSYLQRPNIRFKATSSGCASNRLLVEVDVTGIPPYDAGVIAIDSPYTAVNLGTELVAIQVHNFGTSAISHFPVSYQVDANPFVTDTISDTVQPGDTLAYIFVTPANFSVTTTYAIKSWTSLIGDNYPINDTAYKSVENQLPVYCASGATTIYDDDITSVVFAGINNNSSTPYNGTYSDYTNLPPAHVFRGANYPISVGIGFSSTYGYAGYCEVYIDLNRDGLFTEPGEVVWGGAYASTPLSQILNGVVSIPSGASSGYTRMRVVAVESGTSSSVTPCGTYSYGETEDYKIFISPLLHIDAGLTAFISPTTSESQGVQTPIQVELKNCGLDTLTAVNISWIVDANPLQNYNWSGILPPGQIDTVNVGSFLVNTGTSDLIAYSTLVGDSNTFNDTIKTNCFGLPPITLFLENFDATTSDWTTNTQSLWQHGVPNSTVINYSHSPTRCWKTRLIGDYSNDREDYLYSPAFNFANLTGMVLRFWQWWEAEPLDGGNLQYSYNGTTWITLGLQNDPNGVDWYNTFNNGKVLWTGSFGGWRNAIYDLSQFNNKPYVKFRFYFYTNSSIYNYNGWAIDDFEIRIPKLAYDAGVVAISEPTPIIPGGLVHPKVTIHNFGNDTLITVPVAYVLPGGGFILENWTGILPPDSNANFSFTNSYISPTGSYNFCSFTGIPTDNYYFNDSTCMYVTNSIGIADYESLGFMLGQNVPNPAGDMTRIPYFIPESGTTQFTIENVVGQLLYTENISSTAGNHEIVLDISHFTTGLYFYSLEYVGRKITKKMLIER